MTVNLSLVGAAFVAAAVTVGISAFGSAATPTANPDPAQVGSQIARQEPAPTELAGVPQETGARPPVAPTPEGPSTASEAPGEPTAPVLFDMAAAVERAQREAGFAPPRFTTSPPTWRVADPAADDGGTFPRRELVDEYTTVDLDRSTILHLQEGALTPLWIPGVGSVEALVEHIDVAPNGDRSWGGRLDGFVEDYSVVYTQGDHLSFATIATPDGMFLLEGDGDRGWIFQDTLDELIDPNQSDMVFPEDH